MPYDDSKYEWLVIPGRKVAHAFPKEASEGFGQQRTVRQRGAICGHTNRYNDNQLTVGYNRMQQRCEQCEILLVTNIDAMIHKFFVGHVPSRVRAQRRKLWKAHLMALREAKSL
jgi:hypothetical protein